MENTADSPGSRTLSSVDRALSVIELLAENNGLTVTQLANRLGTGKATAFRLAKTLVERGWAEKDEELRYRLGPSALSLSPGVQNGTDLRRQLYPILQELQDATGETIHLTVLRGRHIVYVEQLVSPKPVHSVSTLGGRSPAHCVSPGLAQLALLPEAARKWVVSTPLRRYTEHSVVDPDAVLAELVRVRERGYAINKGTFRADVGGVGAAVLDARGRPRAGLSVCMPIFRMQSTDLAEIGNLLRTKAVDAQRRLDLGLHVPGW
ncbi:IclR family transcriptional regulator [Gordonia humi]|uniref:Glycerol operon regulatory protein n=1 Tax=Gordonia humi TaxID=686429 RepID=A0A840FFA2_9ACTN|nr:IclR family transcriptional regulator [Gordonia humi]MBB4138127.1 DNA-binding IclR family transcriptional regulator [Gordonia humi]